MFAIEEFSATHHREDASHLVWGVGYTWATHLHSVTEREPLVDTVPLPHSWLGHNQDELHFIWVFFSPLASSDIDILHCTSLKWGDRNLSLWDSPRERDLSFWGILFFLKPLLKSLFTLSVIDPFTLIRLPYLLPHTTMSSQIISFLRDGLQRPIYDWTRHILNFSKNAFQKSEECIGFNILLNSCHTSCSHQQSQ